MILTATGLTKRWSRGATVLNAVDLSLDAGELVVLAGPSGSGKSTLLGILFGIVAADAGTVQWERTSLDWDQVALVPQDLDLLPELTIRENVALALDLATTSTTELDQGAAVDDVLVALDLETVADRLPEATSLGEQQRAAVGRAVIGQPRAVLADEPTSHQDERRAALVVAVLRAFTNRGAACLISSHEATVVDAADRIIALGETAPVPVADDPG